MSNEVVADFPSGIQVLQRTSAAGDWYFTGVGREIAHFNVGEPLGLPTIDLIMEDRNELESEVVYAPTKAERPLYTFRYDAESSLTEVMRLDTAESYGRPRFVVDHAICIPTSAAELVELQGARDAERVRRNVAENESQRAGESEQAANERRCDEGNGIVCRRLAARAEGLGGNGFAALYDRKGCDGGDAVSCFLAAKLLRSIGSGARAGEMYAQGCKLLGLPDNCRPP